MFIPKRINQLLEERRIKKVELCEKVNISTVTLNRTIEKGAEIGCMKLERIADFFRCRWIIFLIGITNNQNPIIQSKKVWIYLPEIQ